MVYIWPDSNPINKVQLIPLLLPCYVELCLMNMCEDMITCIRSTNLNALY